MRAGIVGIVVLDGAAARALRADRRRRARRRRPVRRRQEPTRGAACAGPRRRSQLLTAGARGSGASHKVGHDLKFDAIVLARHGVDAARPRDRHDARELPARRDALGASARGAGARARRLQGAAAKRTSAAAAPRRCPSATLPLERGARLRRRARRPGAAAGGAAPRRCCAQEQLDGALRRPRAAARCRCSSTIERAGIRVDAAALAAQSRHDRAASSTTRSAQIYEHGRRGVQHQLAEAAVARSCSTSCSCRRSSGTARRKTASTAVEVLEELALDARAAAADPRVARAAEAEGHLHRRAAAAGATPRPAACTPASTRRSPPPAGLSSSDPNLQNIPIRTELGREIRARVRRRARPRADLGRLLADRAARARAPVGRRGAGRRLQPRRGHPRSHRAEGVRRRQRARARTSCGGARRSSTTRCSTGRRRSRWPRTSASRSRRRRSSSTPTSPASRRCARSSTHRSPTRARDRRREDDVRPAAAGAGARPAATARSAAGAEREAVNMPIQGTRRRHPQAGDDRRPRGAAVAHAGGRARMILTVHDELLFEAPREAADETAALVRERDGRRGAAERCR